VVSRLVLSGYSIIVQSARGFIPLGSAPGVVYVRAKKKESVTPGCVR